MNIQRLERIFSLLFLFLILTLFYYQIIRGEYFFSLSKRYRIRAIPLMAKRGNILDRNGKVMATQKPIINVIVNPQELKDKEEVFKIVSKILEISFEELLKRYEDNLSSPFMPVTIAKDIPLEKAFLIEEKKPELSGIEIDIKALRFYPLDTIGAHMLGYIGEIGPEELLRLKPYGYRIKTMVGRMGIEKAMDVYLKGEDGGRQIEVDNLGNFIRIVSEKKPKNGKDIKLTIDKEWQEKAYHLLKGKSGAIIIMDIRNGEILVMESSPSFDPNIFITREKEKIESIFHSPKALLLNKTTKAIIPPGSIFKLVTAISGLSAKKIDTRAQYKCEGKFHLGDKKFKCWDEEGHGYQTVIEAIKHSCNVFFYKLSLELGVDKIRHFANLLGLGERTGIEIEEERGFLPSPKWKQIRFKEKWFEGDTVNLSIGQGYILATPLQILRLIAVIGNGGFLIKPQLIKSIDGMDIEGTTKEYTGIDKNILEIIKEGMFKVVNEKDGTGIRAKVEGLEIAAKTATIEVDRKMPHALIAGFLPYSNPKLGFVIFLEHGGRGGEATAELCYSLFSSLKEEVMEYK